MPETGVEIRLAVNFREKNMSIVSLDPTAMLDRALEYATKNISIGILLLRLGLDPNNVTYDAIFNRLLDLTLANLTFSNILALIAAIFLALGFVARTIVLIRILTIVSIVFFLGSAALAGSSTKFIYVSPGIADQCHTPRSNTEFGQKGANVRASIAGLAQAVHDAAQLPKGEMCCFAR